VLTFPARLSVENGRARSGRLRLSPGGVTWRSGLRSTDLTGAAVLTAAMQQVRHRRGDVDVQLRLADGRSARLELHEAEAAATVRMLSGRDAPGLDPTRIRPSGRTWWATACLTLAALWVALMVWMALDGYTATATVVRSADTWTCAVTWQSPSGTPEQDDADCFDEPPGSSLEILVPFGDYEGAVTTRPMLALVGVTGAVPLAAIGALRFRVVARRRRTNVALIRLAEGAGGAMVRDPASSVDRTAAALRRAGRFAWGVTAVGGIGLATSVALGWVMAEADAALQATGITTVGTVVEVHPDSKYSTGGLEVRFPAGGELATRYASIGSDADYYVEGQQVEVLYDRAAPDRFTVDDIAYEPPGTGWSLAVAIVVALLAGPLGIRLIWVRRTTARILAAGSWTPVRVRVRVEDRNSWFTTDGGTVWRSWTEVRWRASGDTLRRLRDWWLSRPEPTGGTAGDDVGPAADMDWPVEGEPSAMQDASWVREGERAVFSPDKGKPLVLARLR
jgi:hypothetical protein